MLVRTQPVILVSFNVKQGVTYPEAGHGDIKFLTK